MKKIIKIIVDILMLILMLLEFSKLYTGQLWHEVFGITLFVLFITHNILNIKFYQNILKGKYTMLRTIKTIVNVAFLLCMVLTIVLGIPISSVVFKALNLNGNMTVRKLHTILGYWDLVLMSLHLGFHFRTIFSKLINFIKDKKAPKLAIYIIEIAIIIFGIKTMIDTNFGAYLLGKSSFAVPSNFAISLINNISIVAALAIITYNVEKAMLHFSKTQSK